MKKISILIILLAFTLLANVSSSAQTEAKIFLNSSECLELEDATMTNNVRVKVAPCSSSALQNFTIEGAGTSGNSVNIKVSSSRCIEIRGANITNGVEITQWNCDNSPEQTFQLAGNIANLSPTRSINGPIRFTHSGKCFDAGNRPWIEQFSCNGSRNQTFEIVSIPKIAINNPQATDSMVLNNSAFDVRQKLPLKLGQVELTDISTSCPNGCQSFSRDSFLTLEGWTPNLSAGSQRDAQAQAIKPALLVDYCVSDAAQRGMNLKVKIFDRNKNTAFANDFSYVITPSECPTNPKPPNPNPKPTPGGSQLIELAFGKPATQSSDGFASSGLGLADFAVDGNTDGAFFNRSVTHTATTTNPWWEVDLGTVNEISKIEIWNRTDCCANRLDKLMIWVRKSTADRWEAFNPAMHNFDPIQKNPLTFTGKKQARFVRVQIFYANADLSLAEVKVFREPTEDEDWDAIKNSQSVKDFQEYKSKYPNGKFIAIANLRIIQLSNPPNPPGQKTVDEQFWDLIKNSKDPKDFQSYLDSFPNGKFAPIARLKIRSDPNPKPTPPNPGGTNLSIEDQFWNRIKNSRNKNDFRSYLQNFPNGKYAPLARLELGIGSGGNPNPTNQTSEDVFWNSIKNSTDRKDFDNYLTQFGQNGKYAPLARQKLIDLPTPAQLDDRQWNRIRNSSDSNDFQKYLNDFPNGNHVREARLKKDELVQKQAETDFLRNAQFGSLNEIRNVRRVFITSSDLNSRDRIVEELQKDAPSLIFVNNPQSADFFIEYQLTVTSACDPGTSTAANACELHTGKLWLHTKGLVGTGNEFNRILWSTVKTKSYSNAGINFFDKNPAAQAGDSLAKDLKSLGF